MNRPNILYIHSHDTGRYVQPYGYAIPTPNFQKLAEQGVLFRQAFCAAPTCSPSRAALLTGECPHSAGMLGLAHRGWSLNDYSRHIVHTLRKAGYYSALAGVQHIVDWKTPELIGYDEILPLEDGPEDRDASFVVPAALEFLNRPHETPFFLSVGFFQTHREYPTGVPDESSRYIRPPAPVPDTPETRRDMAAFIQSARDYDSAVGEVLAALDKNGLADNTLVISTTDHGVAFPGMKCTLTDHGTGVMLIMRGPGGFSGGRVLDAMVTHLDLYPTLCDYLGLEKPDWLQGTSLLPLLSGQVDIVHDEIFSEVTYHAAYEPMRAIRTQRWKYIRRFDNRQAPVLPNCDAGPSKTLWLENSWRDKPQPSQYLFDLLFDPNEAHSLAANPQYAATKAQLSAKLTQWMSATSDPLLAGPVPLVPGGYTDDPDGERPT